MKRDTLLGLGLAGVIFGGTTASIAINKIDKVAEDPYCGVFREVQQFDSDMGVKYIFEKDLKDIPNLVPGLGVQGDPDLKHVLRRGDSVCVYYHQGGFPARPKRMTKETERTIFEQYGQRAESQTF